jgi:hypothetical protein
MSLDVYLMVTKPVAVYERNITHNLGKMASEVKLSNSNGLSLYDVLWRPDEHELKLAKDIVELLDEGWEILDSEPDRFRQLNPENGWGNYDNLIQFVYDYRNACREEPDATVQVWR